MFKKILSMIICCTIILSCIGCGSDNSEPDSASTQGEGDTKNQGETSETADPYGTYESGIELSAVRYLPDGMEFAEGEDINNNVWAKAYEDELGIKLNYLWTTPQNQYSQKLNVSIVTQVPDLMWVDAAQLKRMVEDGMIADLTDVYNNYKSDFTDSVMNEDGTALESATFDNKIYGLPHIQSGYGSMQVLWLRTDWLEQLNLSEPATMEDVLNIAKAFAKEDPDGNGKDDTYGLGINKGLIGLNNLPYAVLDGFFNGYHAYPSIWLTGDDGKLEYGGIQPEIKTALQELQTMYKDGIIDLEFGVKDATKVSEDVNSGKVGMFFGQFWNSGSGWLQDGKVGNPDSEWKAFPILSADGEEAKAMAPFATKYYTVVSKDCENPEAAVKMYNLMLEKNFGETAQPEIYNVNKDNIAVFNYCYSYGEPPMKNLNAQEKVTKALDSEDTQELNPEELKYYDNCKLFEEGDLEQWGTYKMYGPAGSLSVINDYVTNDNIMIDQYFGAPTDSMAEKEATLQKLQLETFTKIITGNADIDEFDKFIENWKNLGGQQITDEVNAWLSER